MITYQQSTGKITSGEILIATGYSGNGPGLNNPAMQNVHAVGPIPQGQWQMVAFFEGTYEDKGPHVIKLAPMPGTDALGRSGFLVHGDNSLLDHTASEGCIIAPRFARDRMWEDADKLIEVIP